MVLSKKNDFSPTVPTCCVTVDVDISDNYREIHGLPERPQSEAPDPIFKFGIRRCLDFFDELGIPVTLFVIGETLQKVRHQHFVEKAFEQGNEIANHTWSHPYNLSELSARQQLEQMRRADEKIAELTENEFPRGFRAPGYNLGKETLHLCRELGYDYDSSIMPSPPYFVAKQAIMFAQNWLGRPSRSSSTPIRNAFGPLKPYFVEPANPWKPVRPEQSSLIEIPMAVLPKLRIPVIGTSLHLLDYLGMTNLAELLIWQFDRILQLEFHAIDFVDKSDLPSDVVVDVQPDLNVLWEVKQNRYETLFESLQKHYTFRTVSGLIDDL